MESYYCLSCSQEVTSRQEALLCDGCDKWQHRRCQTGITRVEYRTAVRSGLEVIWRCLYCSDTSTPIAESTRLSYEDLDAFDILASFEVEEKQTGMGTFSVLYPFSALRMLCLVKEFCFEASKLAPGFLEAFQGLQFQPLRLKLHRPRLGSNFNHV